MRPRRFVTASVTASVAVWALVLAACSADAGADRGGAADTASSARDGGADGATDGTGRAGGSDGGGAADGEATDAGIDGGSADKLWAVGVTRIEITGAAGRKLPTEVWYPIEPGSQGKLARYALGLIPSPGGALRDAPAAKGPFPLVAFSHGNQGVRDQSVFLTEHLARHGYVVIAPDHVGNTVTTYDGKLTGVMALWRPQDIRAAIDRMAHPAPSDPTWFSDLADTHKVAVTGHSYGGFTALAVAGIAVDLPAGVTVPCDKRPADDPTCVEMAKRGEPPWDLSDPRVAVAIPLAHALYGAGALNHASAAKLAVPVVMMAATGDTLARPKVEAEPLYAALTAPAALITLQGGDHFSFSNLCDLKGLPVVPASLKGTLDKLCAPDAVPSVEQSHEVVQRYALAACDIWLKGRDDRRADFAAAAPGQTVYTLKSKGILP